VELEAERGFQAFEADGDLGDAAGDVQHNAARKPGADPSGGLVARRPSRSSVSAAEHLAKCSRKK
jgi:hypothetical protein